MDKTVETLIANLIEVAKFHDWDYGYSDDYSAFRSGSEHRNRINEAYRALKAVDHPLAVKTWNSFAPENHRYVMPEVNS